jgi:predicted Zn-dependent protease
MGVEPGGLTVTSASDVALAHYVEAVDLMLAGRSDVDDSINAALAYDEHMVLALVLRSLRARMRGQIEQSAADLRSAGVAAQAATDRERGVVAFFEAFFRPDRFETERRGLDHLRAYPRDRLVVWYMHILYNLMLPTRDRRDRHRALALEHSADWGDDWFLLGEQAFIATEAGEHVEARTLAERALTARPENAPAAHAMAHALLETGAEGEGRAWLGQWLDDWGSASTNLCHLTWHQALLELADGESVAAARRLDAILDEASPPLGALSDGASLMWRLHLEGWPDPLPWQALEHSPVPPGFVFGALHRALVLAGLGRSAEIRSNAEAMNGAVADACRALADFAEGDANAAADRLLEHEPDLVTIGGSRAQLEVLDDTLITALARSGRANAAAERLEARLARRPSLRDRRWHATIAA